MTETIDQTPRHEHHRHHRVRRPSGEPPPLPRQLNKPAVAWLAVFVFWAVLWIWVFFTEDAAIWISERDFEVMDPIVDNRTAWLTPIMEAVNDIGSNWAVPVLGWITIVGGLVFRRIRHTLLLMIAFLVVVAVVGILINIELFGYTMLRPRPLGVEIIGDWDGFAQPSRVAGQLAVAQVGLGLTLIPLGRWRRRWWLVSALGFAVFTYAQLYTGVEHLTDVFAGCTVGVAATLVLYRLGAPEAVFPIAYGTGKTAHLDVTGARGEAIRVGLRDQLGIDATDITPVGLEGSAGSTPLRIRALSAEGRPIEVFAKLYASSHLRSDRAYKLVRTLIYGRLEDETRYTSVQRLVEHEDYMLHVMRDAGIPSAEPYGIVEITPNREYLLVNEFLHDAVEIGDAELTDEMIDEALAIVAQMWKSGLAHRDIKPANLMVQDGRIRVIDVAFGQVRPSPWRQAVDLANMMLVLALRTSPEKVYLAALHHFSEADIAEAFAASRGVTLPSALRADVRRDGRALLDRFRELAPDRPRVAIQRWSLRRVGLTAFVVLLGLATVGLVFGFAGVAGLTPGSEMPPELVKAPWCEENGSGLIVAQSVPTAQDLPCLQSLPAGWIAMSTSVDQDGTTVRFDSDRAGDAAAVLHFEESCDTGDAVRATDVEIRDEGVVVGAVRGYVSVERLDPAYRATWYRVGQGGCWWWEFDFDSGVSSTLAVELDDSIFVLRRDRLQRNIAETFVDRDL